MKRLAYSFFLIAVMSCGTSSKHDNVITLQFRDLSMKRFYLLAMRDSSMIVSPVDSVLDFSFARKILFTDIARVKKLRGSVPPEAFIGLGGGSLAGCIGGVAIVRADNSLTSLSQVIAYTMGAGIVGGIAGCYLAGDEITYDLTDPIDRLSLKQFPLFPDNEPPQLKNIK